MITVMIINPLLSKRSKNAQLRKVFRNGMLDFGRDLMIDLRLGPLIPESTPYELWLSYECSVLQSITMFYGIWPDLLQSIRNCGPLSVRITGISSRACSQLSIARPRSQCRITRRMQQAAGRDTVNVRLSRRRLISSHCTGWCPNGVFKITLAHEREAELATNRIGGGGAGQL
ncbi:hypothetical protein COLU111180_16480 [Cohnella lubricantis]|nr:hypothetical protein [Cohnella lubricantis]